jgi:copper transport protein
MVLTVRSSDAVESTAIILRRFSLVALISVIALVVAGLTLTLTGSGEHLGSLLTTTWGRLVVTKMALTSIVIVLAAWNRRSLVPAIVEPTTDPALRADRWRTLLRTVRLEALVIVVVIGFTAVLVNVPPARTAVTIDTSPISITKRVDTGEVALSVTPALVGPNQIETVFTDGTGQPVTVANTMTIEFSQPAAGLEPITRQVSAASPGLFVYEGNELSIPGDWTITVAIRTGDFSEQRTTFEVPVRR